MTSAKSISRSLRKGRGFVIPHAALIPFRIAPNTTVAAQSRPKMPTMPVTTLDSTTLETVSPMKSLDTGMMSAVRSASSRCSSAVAGLKYPSTEIIAKSSGKIEISV